jgi:hypothetical protein
MTWNEQGDALMTEVEGAIGVGVFHPVMHQLASKKLLDIRLSSQILPKYNLNRDDARRHSHIVSPTEKCEVWYL